MLTDTFNMNLISLVNLWGPYIHLTANTSTIARTKMIKPPSKKSTKARLAWPPGVTYTSPIPKPGIKIMPETTVVFHLGFKSQTTSMMLIVRPVEEPKPRVTSISKNKTENSLGRKSNFARARAQKQDFPAWRRF